MKLNESKKKKLVAVGLAAVTVGGVFAYNQFTVNSTIKPTTIVVAKTDIPAHTKINADMLMERQIPGDAIPPNALREKKENVVGKWTVDNYSVSKNSFLFKDKVLNKKDMPDSAILSLKPGEVAFPLLVDIESSSGNSIVPDTFVDLYFKKTVRDDQTNEDKVVSGGMFQHIRVTSAKDSETLDAFKEDQNHDKSKSDNNTAQAKPKVTRLYTFAVTPEQLQFLVRAKSLGQVIPIATGDLAKTKSPEQIRDYFATTADQIGVLNYINNNSQNPLPKETVERVMQSVPLENSNDKTN